MGTEQVGIHERKALVSTTVLVDLADKFGTDTAERFVRAFADLWPVRRKRIHTAIHTRDIEAAMDAVLALRSGAMMAGAGPLARHTDLLCTTLLAPGTPGWADASRLLEALDDLGEGTVEILRGCAGR